jgi:hypothetical protein
VEARDGRASSCAVGGGEFGDKARLRDGAGKKTAIGCSGQLLVGLSSRTSAEGGRDGGRDGDGGGGGERTNVGSSRGAFRSSARSTERLN